MGAKFAPQKPQIASKATPLALQEPFAHKTGGLFFLLLTLTAMIEE
jgi:hypothetical protein